MGGLGKLTVDEREIISRELSQGRSARQIATILVRHHSTIAREVERNGGATAYRAMEVQSRCDVMRGRPKVRKLVASKVPHDAVNAGLVEKWPPKQISERPKKDFPDDERMRVSHESPAKSPPHSAQSAGVSPHVWTATRIWPGPGVGGSASSSHDRLRFRAARLRVHAALPSRNATEP